MRESRIIVEITVSQKLNTMRQVEQLSQSYKEKLSHLGKTYDAKYKSSVRVVKKHA